MHFYKCHNLFQELFVWVQLTVILRCPPGQRDASKLWYQFFVEKLQRLFGAIVCKEQPCVLKVENEVAMVMHVDDIMFLGDQSWIHSVFLPGLEKEFRLTSSVVDRSTRGILSFSKDSMLLKQTMKSSQFSQSQSMCMQCGKSLQKRMENLQRCPKHHAV